jgi:hypothetical protein
MENRRCPFNKFDILCDDQAKNCGLYMKNVGMCAIRVIAMRLHNPHNIRGER